MERIPSYIYSYQYIGGGIFVELIKKNIHMDRIRAEAVTQFTTEDDINIPDSKPDVNTLNLEKGEVVIEEIRPGTDSVNVKGYLAYVLLYHTQEEGSSLVVLEGKLPFDEKLNLQGVGPADTVEAEGETDDLTVSMINSRKLNLQALITLTARVSELYDEEIPVAFEGGEIAEYRRTPMELVQIAICKNDIFRLKEEMTLPGGHPNIFQILWSDVSLGDMEFKAQEEKLALSGDVHVFVLYEGEGEAHPIRSYETTIPFSGALECHGCRDGMIPDIRYRAGQTELSVRPDSDGEERCIGFELALEISMRIYEEEKTEVLSDIYGVTSEITTTERETALRRLLARVTGKTKVTEHVPVGSGRILQLLHSEGSVTQDQQRVVENGIFLQGSLNIKLLYITGEDESPYGCTRVQIPYQYTLEVPDIAPQDSDSVRAELEQLQVMVSDGEEVDVKAVLSFSTVVFQSVPVSLIGQVTVAPLDTAKLGELPGMAVYFVKAGDNLWNIGRKYYVTVDYLKKLNDLESDEVKPGQKLLIAKSGTI